MHGYCKKIFFFTDLLIHSLLRSNIPQFCIKYAVEVCVCVCVCVCIIKRVHVVTHAGVELRMP